MRLSHLSNVHQEEDRHLPEMCFEFRKKKKKTQLKMVAQETPELTSYH